MFKFVNLQAIFCKPYLLYLLSRISTLPNASWRPFTRSPKSKKQQLFLQTLMLSVHWMLKEKKLNEKERVNWLIDWRRQYYLFYLKTFAAVLTTKISINVTMCCCGVYVKNLIQKQLTHNMTHSSFGAVIFYPFILSPLAYYCFLYCEYFLSLFTNAARIYIHTLQHLPDCVIY